MNTEDYLHHLEKWHATCQWIHRYRKPHIFIGAPRPMDIIETIYGREKQVDSKIKAKTLDRLLVCIAQGEKLPTDLLNKAMQRTCNRINFDNEESFEKALSITCALYKRYLYDYKKGDIKMSLDPTRSSRDYLYGRLLAIADNVERWALDINNENRPTNADRFMQRFSQQPFSTWKIIELALKPSFARLNEKAKGREKLLDEVMNLFDAEDFIKDTPLSGEFLLGYHCQRQAFYHKGGIEDVRKQV
jgi:CRISPR-associated protein Csd1